MTGQIKYLADKALAELRGTIGANLARYKNGDFLDLADVPSWDVKLGVEYDEHLLATLNKSVPTQVSAIDRENSKIVGMALAGLTPAMANEERIWVRLCHLEALDYCRARWLNGKSDDDLVAEIGTHLFASSQTGIRDDNALSRLWWNYHIARTCMPNDVDTALNLILKRADIRSNFVERIWMTSRQRIASSVLKAMRDDAWITDADTNFREFMKAVNRFGGGMVFEALEEQEVDGFIADCINQAKKKLAA